MRRSAEIDKIEPSSTLSYARPQQDARRQHADDARQLQLLTQRGQRKANQKDECE
ncbi:MAG: hypothetical protein ACLRSD_04060 [Oscillibacter sp.]